MASEVKLVAYEESRRYVQIRRYAAPPDEVDEFMRRVEQGFVPIISRLPGFVGYYAIDLGHGQMEFANIFETREAAVASLDAASAWVAEHLAELHTCRTEVLDGRIRFGVQRQREPVGA